jgi:hypothetical protein
VQPHINSLGAVPLAPLQRPALRTPPQADDDEHDPKHDQDDPHDHKRPGARSGKREHACRDEDDNGRREEQHEAKPDKAGGRSRRWAARFRPPTGAGTKKPRGERGFTEQGRQDSNLQPPVLEA